tara:strand:- start:5351 stop:5773 length:423 start_codon:yes stop_codon:yes gene_type:complete
MAQKLKKTQRAKAKNCIYQVKNNLWQSHILYLDELLSVIDGALSHYAIIGNEEEYLGEDYKDIIREIEAEKRDAHALFRLSVIILQIKKDNKKLDKHIINYRNLFRAFRIKSSELNDRVNDFMDILLELDNNGMIDSGDF